MKRKNDNSAFGQDVLFEPAVTPIEASVIPAKDARGYGALRHAKAAFQPGMSGRPDGVRMPRLRAWGPQRTKI